MATAAVGAPQRGRWRRREPAQASVQAPAQAPPAQASAQAPASRAGPAPAAARLAAPQCPDDGPLRLRALAEFGCGALVDIGANLGRRSPQDLAEQLLRSAAAGVEHIVLTGCSVKGSHDARRVAEQWAGAKGLARARGVLGAAARAELDASGVQALPALAFTAGVHPHEASTCDADTMAALRELARSPQCVAIGECGLDYDRMRSPRAVQLEWFRRQVELAVELGLPLFVHERERDASGGAPLGSSSDLLSVLDACGVETAKVCVHCFTGAREVLRDYVSRGYRIGLTGFAGMQKRGAHLRALLSDGEIPLTQLMIETDCPYMMPDRCYLPQGINVQGRKNEPCAMPAVCRAVAECYSLPPSEVAVETTACAKRFFGL